MTQGKLTKDDLNPQFRAEIDDLITNGNSHIGSTILSETGEHGIRYWENKLSVLNNSVWQSVTSDAGIKTYFGHLNLLEKTGLHTIAGALSITDGAPVEVFESDKVLIEVFNVGTGQILQRFTIFGAARIERYMRCRIDNQWQVDYPLDVGVMVNGWIRENVPLSNSYLSTSDKTAASSKVANMLYELINGHIEDPNVHVTNEERSKWNGAFCVKDELTKDWSNLPHGSYSVHEGTIDDSLKLISYPYGVLVVHGYSVGGYVQIYYPHEGNIVYRYGGWGGSLKPWMKIPDKAEFDQLFQSASDVKTNVSQAINEKGGSASPTDTGAQLAAKIRAIKTGKQVVEGTFNVPAVQIGQTINIPVATVSFNPRNIVTPIVGSKMVHGKIWQGIGQYFHSPLIYVTGSGPYNITMDVKNPGPGVPPAGTATYTITE